MQKELTLVCLGLLMLLSVGYFSPYVIYGAAVDPNEPNDTLETATPITPGTYAGLTLVGADQDWFKITVPAWRLIEITVDEFICIDLEEILYLYLLDEDDINYGSDMVYLGQIANISTFLTKETTIYVQIYPKWAYQDSNYTLKVEIIDPTTDPKYDYGLEKDDQLEYTVTNSLDITATDKFYTEVGDFIENNLTGEGVLTSNFSLKSFIQDMETFLSEPLEIQLTINDIFNIDEYPWDYLSQDIISGDIRTAIDGDWKLPTEYLVSRSAELSTLVEKYFDPTFYDETVEEYFGLLPTLTENMTDADFNDLPFMQSMYFNDMADFMGFDEISLENGTEFPAPPNNHYFPWGGEFYSAIGVILSAAKICQPTDFSFKAFYDWGLDVYKFMKAYLEENGDGSPLSNYTLAEYIDMAGISTFYVDKQSIGITWASTAIDLGVIADLIGTTEGELHDQIETTLHDVGIDFDASSAAISMALEYDPEMVLASFAFYIDVTIKIDSTDLPENLDIYGETVTVYLGESIVKKGLEPPTEEEIQNGDLGENRDLTPSTESSTTSPSPSPLIPGYPLLLLGLISITAIFPILKQMKRKTK